MLAAAGYPIRPEGEDAYYRPGSKRAIIAARHDTITNKPSPAR